MTSSEVGMSAAFWFSRADLRFSYGFRETVPFEKRAQNSLARGNFASGARVFFTAAGQVEHCPILLTVRSSRSESTSTVREFGVDMGKGSGDPAAMAIATAFAFALAVATMVLIAKKMTIGRRMVDVWCVDKRGRIEENGAEFEEVQPGSSLMKCPRCTVHQS